MTPTAQNFLISLQGKIGANELIATQGRLEKIPDDKITNLALVELKKPSNWAYFRLTFWWSWHR